MGTTSLLSIGVRAMAASYASMQTTGNNIANAGVEGYGCRLHSRIGGGFPRQKQ